MKEKNSSQLDIRMVLSRCGHTKCLDLFGLFFFVLRCLKLMPTKCRTVELNWSVQQRMCSVQIGVYADCVLCVILAYEKQRWAESHWKNDTSTHQPRNREKCEAERMREADSETQCKRNRTLYSCTHGEMKVKLKLKLLPYMFTVHYIHGTLFYVGTVLISFFPFYFHAAL